MISHVLYFVTDCDFPRFPLTAISRHFRVVSIPVEFSDLHWFNWEASGCLVLECQNRQTTISLLESLCAHWISIPTVLYGSEESTRDSYPEVSCFSARLNDSLEVADLARQLSSLVAWDQEGDPSPLEIRQRLGQLANQERRVLQLSLEGQTSKEIANHLGIRSQTVDKYKRKALARMKSKNLTLLIRQLYQTLFHQSFSPMSHSVDTDSLKKELTLGAYV